jgi:hypothetical protein
LLWSIALSAALLAIALSIALSLSIKRYRFVICSIGRLVTFTGEEAALSAAMSFAQSVAPSPSSSEEATLSVALPVGLMSSLERRSRVVGCFVAFSRELLLSPGKRSCFVGRFAVFGCSFRRFVACSIDAALWLALLVGLSPSLERRSGSVGLHPLRCDGRLVAFF